MATSRGWHFQESRQNLITPGAVQDRGDGSYAMKWRTERAATYTTAVLLGGAHILSSPLTTRISPNVLHPGNTLINGGRLLRGQKGMLP